MKKVYYIREYGALVKSLAFYTNRTIPGQWMIGDRPLCEFNCITEEEFYDAIRNNLKASRDRTVSG
jgi:hypothetical protein